MHVSRKITPPIYSDKFLHFQKFQFKTFVNPTTVESNVAGSHLSECLFGNQFTFHNYKVIYLSANSVKQTARLETEVSDSLPSLLHCYMREKNNIKLLQCILQFSRCVTF